MLPQKDREATSLLVNDPERESLFYDTKPNMMAKFKSPSLLLSVHFSKVSITFYGYLLSTSSWLQLLTESFI